MKKQYPSKRLFTRWVALAVALILLLLAIGPSSRVAADPLAGTISGTVYRDFDSDGIFDANEPGIAGITVTAVDNLGSISTVTTGNAGTYTTASLSGTSARIEFTLPTDGSLDFLNPSVAGGTTVQFIDISGGNASNINSGFLNPAQYSIAAPNVVVPRWTRGEPTTAPNNADATVRGHTYNANGANAPLTDYATYQQVGTIFGLAHQTQSGVIFGSTYVRRGAAVGPTNTTGTIYKLTGTGAPSAFIDLTSIVNTGANPHPNGAGTNWIVDGATYPLVGKIGLGDLEISDDETMLYTVNLNERELVIIPLTFDNAGQPIAPASGDVATITIPVPTDCDDNGSNPNEPDATDWRPFALKYFDGKLYVGGVCTAESMIAGLNPATTTFATISTYLQYLDAHVYEFDPATNTFNTTPILSIPLNYSKEAVNDGMTNQANDGEWLPWTNNWRPNWSAANGGAIRANPQPMLTDIEFDGRGFMFLGFRDRFGDQAYDSGDPGPNNAATTDQRFGGDFLLACVNGSGNWQLESGAVAARSCTNGLTGETRTATNPPSDDANPGSPIAEFFHADQYLPNGGATAQYHDETALGTLAMLYGSGELVATKYDSFEAFEGGTIVYDTDNGNRLRAVQLYEATTGFGKAGGLGDVELLGGAAPIEVGNRVWQDNDSDGIQDPSEPPISGVTVGLYDSTGTLLATDATDANGLYYFTNALNIGTVSVRVTGSDNDAEQDIAGPMTLNSGDLEIGTNDTGTPAHYVGIRFTGLNIPQGATITSAYVQFTADGGASNNGNPASFTVVGHDADNAPVFTTTNNNISSIVTRPRTTATVLWSGIPTWAGGASGVAQQTADIATIVQEIVDRPGWTSGNAMVFIINPTTSPGGNHRDAESVDGSVANAPLLTINYVLPGSGTYANLQYRSNYEIRVNLAQASLNGLSVTTPDNDATSFGDIRDSDGQIHSNGYVAVNFTTSGPGDNNHTFDFGFVPRVSLGDRVWNDEDNDGQYDQPVRVGDYVWYDLNSNGLQDAGESGVLNVSVALHRATDANCAAAPLALTSTGPDGRYLFDNLPPGDYFVCFDLATLPAGFTPTAANVGGDDAIDSDANPATGQTAATGPLTAGQQNLTLDMGIVSGGGVSVGDRVWYDNNNNGRQDAGELGVPGVTVRLFTVGQTCADTPVATLATDNNGHYLFTGLASDNYFVCFDLTTTPPGYTPTTANNQADDSLDSDPNSAGQTAPTGSLSAGQMNLTLDMGLVSTGNVTVGNYVWFDDNLNGLQDANEAGVPDVQVRLYRNGQTCGGDTPMAVALTDTSGGYLFTGLPSGSYFVCFDLTSLPAGYTATTQNVGGDDTVDSDADTGTGATAVTAVLPVGGSDLTLDMGIRPTIGAGLVAIGDRVWYDDNRNGRQDVNEAGVPGVTVALHTAGQTCADAPVTTTPTNNSGYYLFNNQTPGDYFVCFSLATLPNGYVVTLQDATGNDGNDSDANATTGQTGNTGTIPANTANLSLDMGVYAPDHELPIGGVTVQIYAAATACDGTSFITQVTTDANGNYVFPNLPAGDYYVHIPASNFTAGQALEYMISSTGNDPAPDPDGNSSNVDDNGTTVVGGACNGGVSSPPVTLAVNSEPTNDGNTAPNTPDSSHNLTVDFGLFEPLCIGDLVWHDADNSGTVNGTEYGLNGITLNLYADVDGDGIFEPGGDDGAAIASTTTAQVGGVDGSYSFCNLAKGDYFIHVSATEFQAGDLLYLFGSSTANNNPETTPVENDDNGNDGGNAAANGIASVFPVSLVVRTEPTTDNNTNDNGRRDSSTNQTVDLGVFAQMDYGDLPTTYNKTIFGENGPRHPNTGLILGTVWDADNDGQESAAANGDDTADSNDDEDGITVNSATWGSGTGSINVTGIVGGPGCLIGWADYNGDGDFGDDIADGQGAAASELLFVSLVNGAGTINLATPNSADSGGTFVYPTTLNMRYRLFPANDPVFTVAGLALDGNGCPATSNTTAQMAAISIGGATGGEVEDYQQGFGPTAISLATLGITGSNAMPWLVVGITLLLLLTTSVILYRQRTLTWHSH